MKAPANSPVLFGTLRRQLIVGVACAIALLTIAFVAYLTHWQEQFLLQRQVEHAASLARTLATSSATWVSARDAAGLQELVDAQRRYKAIAFALVTDERGQVLADTDRRQVGRFLLDLPPRPIETMYASSFELIDIATPIQLGERPVGWIRVGLGALDSRNRMEEIRRSGLLFTLLTICLTTAFSAWLGTRLTRRLATLDRAMARLEAGDTAVRVKLPGEDEAARLADGFNRMQEALASRLRQQQAAELALRESEERLSYVILATREAEWDWDLVQDSIKHNRRWSELLGLRDDGLEHPAGLYFALVHPDDLAPLRQRLADAGAPEGGEFSAEYRLRGRDGVERWVADHGMVVRRRSDGHPLRLVGAFADITERKEAELALRESSMNNARLAAIVESSNDAIIGKTIDGRVTTWNPAAAQMFGWRPEEAIGRPLSELIVPPELQAEEQQILARIRQGETVPHFTTRRRRKNGSEIDVSVTVSPVHGAQGEIVGASKTARDVTALIEARRALETAEAKYRALVEQSLVGVYLLQDERLAYVNPRFAEIFGYAAPADIAGRLGFASLVAPDERAALMASLERRLAGEDSAATASFAGIDRQGRRIHLELFGQRILHQGRPAVLGALIDVSERKRQEEELERHRHHLEELVARRTAELAEAKNAAEAASHAKGDFLANMSHEIRTPMNAVLGLAYLLEKASLPPEARDLVRKIRSAGRSLQGIINDILDYSKIESGRLEIEHAPFSLAELLERLATVMGTNAGDKEIELAIAPPPAGVDLLLGDALRLEQVLVNLTGNAIKFTAHGHVEVLIELLASEEAKVALRFTVIDSGIGIPLAKQKELFQPFTQADSSTTRRFGGTGLGLAISRRLVGLMGGEIGLASEPGAGSEFWFVLTFERLLGQRWSSPEMADLHVLIADDNAIAREALRLTAAGLGWEVTTVDSGEAAVSAVLDQPAGQRPSDVILLDWKMPGLDGLAAARRIHAARPGQHAPMILLVTAYSREALLAQPGAELAQDILSKPVTPSGLYNAVARARQLHLGEPGIPEQATRRLAGIRLLVVDDSDINREVAARIFADEGADIALAEDGRAALAWLGAHPGAVDVVLMDVQMPVMDGYEATRAIRADPALAALPVVALTAGAFREMEEAARAAGMDDYIAKPFDVAGAVAQIRRLAGKAALPPQPAPLPAPPPPAGAALDLPRALAVWKDEAVYRRYLKLFARDHAASARDIARLPPAEGRRLAHRLKGVAGNLMLDAVAAAAAAVDSALREGEATVALATLDAAIADILPTIAALPEPTPLPPPALPPDATANPADLLAKVLGAFGSDDPAAVEPVLGELAKYLPAAELAPLQSALENFDFRGGEAATRQLAERFAPPAEEDSA